MAGKRYIYQGNWKDVNGLIVPSANVTVYLAGTSTLATIYSTETGSAVSGSVVTSDTDTGYFSFWVDLKDYDGYQRFKIVLSKDGYRSKTYDDLEIYGSDRYIVDAIEADQGVVGNSRTLKTYVDAIGSSTAIIYFAPGTYTLTTSETVPSNITLEFAHGVIFNGAGTLTINGEIAAGLTGVFGTVTVVFGKPQIVHPEWWYVSEWGAAISSAAQSIADVGGKVAITQNMTTTTPINATNLYDGIVFEGLGGGVDGVHLGPMITGQHTGVLFDCTGSRYLTFRDFSIKGHATTTPTVGFLLARETAGSSSGEHNFFNINTDVNSEFSVAAVYNYGSEINNWFGCSIANAIPGGKTMVFTGYNVSSVTSTFQTIATGVQSNTVFNLFGCSLYNYGGAGADLIYLESVSDLNVFGGFWYNATGAASSRSYVYIDTTNSTSNYLNFTGIRTEPGTYKPDYAFYLGDTAATILGLKIDKNRLTANTALLYAHNNVELYDLFFSDANASGAVSVYSIRDSEINGGVYTLRAGGTAYRVLVNTTSPTVSGTNNNGITINRSDSTVSINTIETATGLIIDRGNPSAYDFSVGDLTTDGTWRDLDLSAIVSSNTKRVFLSVVVTDDLVARILSFKKKGVTNDFAMSSISTQVANQAIYADLIVGCDTNQVIQYNASNTTWSNISIIVRGWTE